jgi:hypothetical protein
MTFRAVAVLTLATAVACTSTPARSQRVAGGFVIPPDPALNSMRYRLLLRENPVDPGEAFRCYGSCQPQTTPRGYLECLSACPGFEITDHEYCSKDDVPPFAACVSVRKIPVKEEVPAGLMVLAVVGGFVLAVAAQSLCTSSQNQCGYPDRSRPQ